MKKLFLAVAFVIALSVPVFAGHSLIDGSECTCGCSACICDPGEVRQLCKTAKEAPVAPQSDAGTPLIAGGALGAVAVVKLRKRRIK